VLVPIDASGFARIAVCSYRQRTAVFIEAHRCTETIPAPGIGWLDVAELFPGIPIKAKDINCAGIGLRVICLITVDSSGRARLNDGAYRHETAISCYTYPVAKLILGFCVGRLQVSLLLPGGPRVREDINST